MRCFKEISICIEQTKGTNSITTMTKKAFAIQYLLRDQYADTYFFIIYYLKSRYIINYIKNNSVLFPNKILLLKHN